MHDLYFLWKLPFKLWCFVIFLLMINTDVYTFIWMVVAYNCNFSQLMRICGYIYNSGWYQRYSIVYRSDARKNHFPLNPWAGNIDQTRKIKILQKFIRIDRSLNYRCWLVRFLIDCILNIFKMGEVIYKKYHRGENVWNNKITEI